MIMKIDNYYIKNDNIIDLSRILDRGQVQGFDQDRLSNNIGEGFYENLFHWDKDIHRIREVQEDISFIDSLDKGLARIREKLIEIKSMDGNLEDQKIKEEIGLDLLNLPSKRDLETSHSLKFAREFKLTTRDLLIEKFKIEDGSSDDLARESNRSRQLPRPETYILRSPTEFDSEEGHLIYKPYTMRESRRFRDRHIKNRLEDEKLLKKIEAERKALYFPEEEEFIGYEEDEIDMDLINPNRLVSEELQAIYDDISRESYEIEPEDPIESMDLEDMIRFIDKRRIKLDGLKENLIDEVDRKEVKGQKLEDIREIRERLDLLKLNILEDKILLKRIKKVHNRELVYQLLK